MPFTLEDVEAYFDTEVDQKLGELGFQPDVQRELGGVALTRIYTSDGVPFFLEFHAEITDPGSVGLRVGKAAVDGPRAVSISKILSTIVTAAPSGTLDRQHLERRFREDLASLVRNIGELRRRFA